VEQGEGLVVSDDFRAYMTADDRAAAGAAIRRARSSISTAARFLDRGEYAQYASYYLTQAIATLTDLRDAVDRADRARQAAAERA
jgi:hypothetical protein